MRFLIVMALFLMPNLAFGYTQNDLYNKQQEQVDAQNQLKETQAERKTLQGEVAYFDGQISSLQGQIAATNRELNRLSNEINDTQAKIIQATADLKTAQGQLGEIMRVLYEEGQVSNIELVVKSKNFSEFYDRSEYLESLQLRVKEAADKVLSLKNSLEGKKKKLEEDKQRTSELRQQQQVQEAQLGGQRDSKAALLTAVKGNEAEYQILLTKLKNEIQTIQNSLYPPDTGSYVSLGHVNKGDIIGYEGNSGFSTGPHLHFELKVGGVRVNPLNYVGSSVGYPLPGAIITQGYGVNPAWYGPSGHPGIDYAKPYGSPIYAVETGEIIKRVTGRPNTYPWSFEYGNYVIIQHTNGMISLYGHMM